MRLVTQKISNDINLFCTDHDVADELEKVEGQKNV